MGVPRRARRTGGGPAEPDDRAGMAAANQQPASSRAVTPHGIGRQCHHRYSPPDPGDHRLAQMGMTQQAVGAATGYAKAKSPATDALRLFPARAAAAAHPDRTPA